MYHCKLAGDTVIKYLEVVLGKATSKLSNLSEFYTLSEGKFFSWAVAKKKIAH